MLRGNITLGSTAREPPQGQGPALGPRETLGWVVGAVPGARMLAQGAAP